MKKKLISYKDSGVNIALGNKFVRHINTLTGNNVKKGRKFNNIGSFGSLYEISKLKIKDPIIVSCTDGVGTKLDLANKFKKLDTIGIDLVAMCVNDLIVQGAKPLFFLDYIAVDKLKLNKVKKILKGIFKGCKISGCELVGGETAEMPGIYRKGKFDLAGFSVGVVAKKKLLKKKDVKVNDIVLAFPSSGIHSNGFSLVRKILIKKKIPNNLKNNILKPTKIYVKDILKLSEKKLINSAAHITGGGLIENIVRSIPDHLTLTLDLSKIKVSKIFSWLKSQKISDHEMLKTFNCGVGFCVIAKRKNLKRIQKFFKKNDRPYVIGNITKGSNRINLENKVQW